MDWIFCKDRLPDVSIRVLMCFEKDETIDESCQPGYYVDIGYIDQDRRWFVDDDDYGDHLAEDPVAWMPLPEPYWRKAENERESS